MLGCRRRHDVHGTLLKLQFPYQDGEAAEEDGGLGRGSPRHSK